MYEINYITYKFIYLETEAINGDDVNLKSRNFFLNAKKKSSRANLYLKNISRTYISYLHISKLCKEKKVFEYLYVYIIHFLNLNKWQKIRVQSFVSLLSNISSNRLITLSKKISRIVKLKSKLMRYHIS